MGVGIFQVVVVVVLILVLFGSKHLGRIGYQLGRGVRALKQDKKGDAGDDPEAAQWVEQAKGAARAAKTVRRLGKGGFPWP